MGMSMGRTSCRIEELEEEVTDANNRAENYLHVISELIEAIEEGTLKDIQEACRKAKQYDYKGY